MNKALRFVWLSLLTLFCGVASARTVVFDPATDVSSGASLSKSGITLTLTSETTEFAATDYNGTLSWLFKQKTGFEFKADEAVKINSVTFEYQSAGGYIYDRNYTTSSTEFEGGKTYTVSGEGASKLRFSVYTGPMYFSKITVECTGGDEPGGGEVGTTYSIDDLMTGATDVASATLKFTDAQVVYGDGTNYIVREGGKAIDLMGTSLSLEKGATLNGTVTMNVTYKNGFLKAEDVAGVTNGNNLTQTNATGENVPVTATIEQLGSNYKGDLVLLSQVNIYNDSYGDLGQGAAYYARTGYTNFATLTNIADFLDKVSSDQDATYDIVAWYNEPGAGAIKAKLQIIDFLGGEVAKPAAPVISGNQNFTGSTDVTITAEEGATIFYTTDGSQPTSWDNTYTAPFTITETTTVKAVARVNDIYSDVAEMTFTKEESGVTGSTIADLATAAKSQDNVTLVLNNAKVVYAQGNNYILREDGKAIDLLNTSLSLTQGTTVSGRVQVNVTYTSGILSTSDIEGVTTDANLTATGEAGDMDPIACTLGQVKNYPGDLVYVENQEVWSYGTTWYFYEGASWTSVYLTNAADFNMVANKYYNATLWYKEVSYYGDVNATIVSCERNVTSLNAPFIDGTETFSDNTTVTITADNVATIYYTLDGTDPTTASTVYTEPFTLSESATVKAIAAYKSIVSPVASKVFNKVDANAPMTIEQLASFKSSFDQVTLSLNNALVVYGEDGSYILRENDRAIDILNTTLPLTIGATVSGTVKLKVNYAAAPGSYAAYPGLLTTADLADVTNADNLTVTPGATTDPSPLAIDLAQIPNYPGDLLKVTNATGWNYDIPAFYSYNPFVEFFLTNGADYGVVNYGSYNATVWYNDVSNNRLQGKIIKCSKVITSLDAPVILGEEEFVGKTTVSIAATEGLNVYYTLDGTDPTRQSTVYTEPFTITETTTVKAVTAYLDDYSDIVTKTFTKVGDFETKTIAQLFEGQQAVENVTISLNNAKVVYTEKHDDGTKVAILRENGQALDVISGVLDLPLGSTVTGTFFASVDFNGGIFTTRDVQGETNSYELEYTMPSDEGYNDPIETTVADVHLYPGDLVSIKGLQVLGQDGQYYGFTEDYSFVNLTDNDELANTVSGQKYTVLGWFNAPGAGFADGNASLKAVKLTAEDATKYHNQTIAELNVRRDREDNIRLVLDNAKVVYVRANPYYGTKDIALRQDGKAVVLYNSTLPLELNSTVSGTVKLDFYALAGIPQLREIDGGVTTADSLTITAGASQEVDAVEATMADYDEHRADVIVLRDVKIVYGSQAAYAIEKDGQKIAFKNENEDVDVDALVSNDNLYDVVLWYNGYINDAPEMEFVKAVKVSGSGIYGVEADYGKDGNTYNLQGVKVGKNYRGVVIRDGKKFTKK